MTTVGVAEMSVCVEGMKSVGADVVQVQEKYCFFFLNDPAPPEIHPLPHPAPLPIPPPPDPRDRGAQDRPPLVGEILGLDPDEAGPPEQRAVALEGLERRGRHPLRQARALPLP